MKTKLVKSITSSLLFVCALVGLVAAMSLGTSGAAPTALAPQGCSVQTLRGSYLFATHGWNIVGGVAVPKAIVEAIDFNGDGTIDVRVRNVNIYNSRGQLLTSVGEVDSDGDGTIDQTSVVTTVYDGVKR